MGGENVCLNCGAEITENNPLHICEWYLLVKEDEEGGKLFIPCVAQGLKGQGCSQCMQEVDAGRPVKIDEKFWAHNVRCRILWGWHLDKGP